MNSDFEEINTSSNKNNNTNEEHEEQGQEQSHNYFPMDIKEEFTDPTENFYDDFGINSFSNFREMFSHDFFNFHNMRLLDRKTKKENKEDNKENECHNKSNRSNVFKMKPNTMISKVYCSKYENKDGIPIEESYESQSINQIGEDGHNISEKKELYKNTKTGVQKASQQKMMDEKGTKIIKQRNVKTGGHNQKNILKGLKQEEINQFNKDFDQYKKKVGFNKNYKFLNEMNNAFKMGNKMQLGEGHVKKGKGNELSQRS